MNAAIKKLIAAIAVTGRLNKDSRGLNNVSSTPSEKVMRYRGYLETFVKKSCIVMNLIFRRGFSQGQKIVH
jgi:hypothetical protein